MHEKSYTGINIQWPISQEILSGNKIIETRTYPIPDKYLNQEMLLIETPGLLRKFKARATGIIKFTSCFKYKNQKAFNLDIDKHLVSIDSKWAWKDKKKFGWGVEVIKVFPAPLELAGIKKGIIYTKNIQI